MFARFCSALRSSSALACDGQLAACFPIFARCSGCQQRNPGSATFRTIGSHLPYGMTFPRSFTQQTESSQYIPTDTREGPERQILYSKSHEYLRFLSPDGPEAAAGVSEFASEELGEVVFVEAVVSVEEGRECRVNRGDPVCTLEAVKSVAEVYAPVSGRILKFNPELKENPGIINKDPEGEGWIFVMAVDPAHDAAEVTTHSPQEAARKLLLSPEAYAAHVLRESGKGAER